MCNFPLCSALLPLPTIGQEVKLLQLESRSFLFFFFCFAPASFCSVCHPAGADISVMDTLIVAD